MWESISGKRAGREFLDFQTSMDDLRRSETGAQHRQGGDSGRDETVRNPCAGGCSC